MISPGPDAAGQFDNKMDEAIAVGETEETMGSD
jgi:hypothetical protein